MRNTFKFLALLCLSLLVFACSNDDDTPTPDPVQENPDPVPDPEPEPEVLTGVFKDAEVEGLTFETTTQSGTTNAAGEFTYQEGEQVTFKVGNVTIGSAMGQELVTPITLAQTVEPDATIESSLAQNIAALLQTLDIDGDETNGVSITPEVANNLGIDMIDFAQPVEAVLADIILNVIQNTGVELSIVYPGEAANAMASSLEIGYDAPENFSLTSFLPTLKVYLENWDQNYTLPTAVYKNSFDEMGNLMAVEVIAKYSGKKFFDFTFNAHNEQGLPTNGQWTSYWANGLYGAFPDNTEFTNEIALTYNMDNQISTLSLLYEDGAMITRQFTSYDENNRPLAYFTDFAPDDPNRDFTVNWDFTFDEDGRIATANRLFSSLQTIDANNSYETVTTRDFVYAYDDNGNLIQITYNRVFEDNVVTDGQLENYVTSSAVTENFSYDASNKLTTFVEMADVTPTSGDLYNYVNTSNYDENELIVSYSSTSSSGAESYTNFENGIRLSSNSSTNGLPTYEAVYFSDGSEITTYFYYDENSILSSKYIYEYGPGFDLQKVTIEFYDQGLLSITYVEEYENGIINLITGYDADGNVTFVDSFNADGFLVKTDFYTDGVLSSIQEFGYDANGYINEVIFRDAEGIIVQINNYVLDDLGNILTVEIFFGDGSLWITETWEYDENGLVSQITVDFVDGYRDIYYYEDGVLVRGEFYDDNGDLYDEVDYTNSGKRPIIDLKPLSDNVMGDLKIVDDRLPNLSKVRRLTTTANLGNGARTKPASQLTNKMAIQHLKNIERFNLYQH